MGGVGQAGPGGWGTQPPHVRGDGAGRLVEVRVEILPGHAGDRSRSPAGLRPARRLGWQPVGVDLSGGQLRYARTRLAVVRGDAARLPVADASVCAVTCVLGHTDLPAYPAVVAEAARVLAPGGRFVHLGVHPCDPR
ncbi:class I SAM-dependent methyltransferase [Micromonospora sp. NPDC047740]|uniref:class I SAM-dependent methyltransferase n=1 Tax=Micromonospora sp. NPDC047740 TaxID=3364254 RepID=UPI0037152A98